MSQYQQQLEELNVLIDIEARYAALTRHPVGSFTMRPLLAFKSTELIDRLNDNKVLIGYDVHGTVDTLPDRWCSIGSTMMTPLDWNEYFTLPMLEGQELSEAYDREAFPEGYAMTWPNEQTSALTTA